MERDGEQTTSTRRNFIKTALTGATAAGLAGCSDNENPSSSTQTDTDTETEETTENTGEVTIEQLLINDEEPENYEVDFPTSQDVSGDMTEEEAIEQVADQFNIDIQYQSTPQTQSTIHLEYDDEIIPEEDEQPIDQDIDTVTQQGTITHDSQVPDNLITYMLNGNPRNLNLTTTAQNPRTEETTQETIELNYGNAAAETGITNEFRDLPTNSSETMNLEELSVSNGQIDIVYSTSAELGTEEFGLTFAGASGVCNGAMLQTRTPYSLNMTVIGGEGGEYEISIGQDRAENLITSGVDNSNYILDELDEYAENHLN